MPMPAPDGPTVLRIILGRQLQALREKAGLSHEQAADTVYASAWTIRRMEKAEVGLKLNYVKSLLMAYGITDIREIGAFLDLAREANKPGWWHSYTDVLPTWFRVFPGLEQAAELIRGYEPHCVPGLLQTSDYARALAIAGYPDAAAEETDRRVALRMARQQVLSRSDPPHLWVVIDEAVLRRPAAGAAVMRAQLTRLIEAAGTPSITLQVLPFAGGPHPAMYGMFHLLRFPAAELPDIVYGENMTSAFYLDKPHEVAAYAQALSCRCRPMRNRQLSRCLPDPPCGVIQGRFAFRAERELERSRRAPCPQVAPGSLCADSSFPAVNSSRLRHCRLLHRSLPRAQHPSCPAFPGFSQKRRDKNGQSRTPSVRGRAWLNARSPLVPAGTARRTGKEPACTAAAPVVRRPPGRSRPGSAPGRRWPRDEDARRGTPGHTGPRKPGPGTRPGWPVPHRHAG